MRPILRRDGRRIRVLVAEDEAIIALDLQTIISDALGEVVGVVRSGEEAVQAAGGLRPDMVLLDIRLAGRIDGVDAAEAILGIPGIALILVTADSDTATQLRADRLHVPMVEQPVSPDILLRTIATACGLGSGSVRCAAQVWQISVPVASLFRCRQRDVLRSSTYRLPGIFFPETTLICVKAGLIKESRRLRVQARGLVGQVLLNRTLLKATRTRETEVGANTPAVLPARRSASVAETFRPFV